MYYNNFKDKIKDISNNVSLNTGYYTTSAFVEKTNEVANTCTVVFTDSNGQRVTLDDVTVVLSNNNTIGWFPKDKEYVVVEIKNNVCQVISPYTEDYSTKYRHSTDIKTNILTNFYNYNIGGTIF